MITISRKCPFTGTINQMDIPLTAEQYDMQIGAWQGGTLIQNAFPTLTADQREFIKTGITPEQWERIFGGV
jgi:hypothetical protein